jgi:hypothetical protein
MAPSSSHSLDEYKYVVCVSVVSFNIAGEVPTRSPPSNHCR